MDQQAGTGSRGTVAGPAGTAAGDQPGMPPVVYVPVVELPEEPGVTRMRTHTMRDGRTAVFVYSAPDRLHDLYAAGTPWVLADVAGLQAAFEDVPYDLLFVDQPLHPDGGGER